MFLLMINCLKRLFSKAIKLGLPLYFKGIERQIQKHFYERLDSRLQDFGFAFV